MGILTQDLLLRGSRGETTRMALFDSGASYSIIRRDIAETLGDLARLPEAWEFETAAADHLIVATHAIRLDFFLNLPRFGGHGVKQSGMKNEGRKTIWQIRGRSTHESSRSRLSSC